MNDPLKKYRRKLRMWLNNRRLQREMDYYTQKFNKLGLIIPDEQEINRRLQNKFPQMTAKPKGELNIVAIYHHYNWENEAFKSSLEKFGSVRHYDWFDKFNQQSKDWGKFLKAEMNKYLIQLLDEWITRQRADVIFTYLSGELINSDTIQAIRKHGIPIINLGLNDKEHFVGKVKRGSAYGARDICRMFDLCWTSTEDSLIKYCVEGALPVYLPEGANPQIHRPYNLERTIDVSFVGQCYGNRAEVINEVRKNGITVKAYGLGWPEGPLSTEEMIKMYSKSKINLGFGGVSGFKDIFCLKGRDFEIPMSGGLYLTEEHPELSLFFEKGKEILTYNGINDLVTKIKYYLAHPAEADAIRTSGYRRAMQDHTWEMRFDKIFHLTGLLE